MCNVDTLFYWYNNASKSSYENKPVVLSFKDPFYA